MCDPFWSKPLDLVIFYHFFSIYVNQNYVRSDLSDVTPAYGNIGLTSQETQEMIAARHHDLTDAALTFVKFQITHPAKLSAVLDIDHVLRL